MKKLFSWQNLTNPFLLVNAITGPFIRKALLSKIDGVLVEYPAFVKLLKEGYEISKPIYFLPNRFFEANDDLLKNEKLIFVIPGSINEKRKNYDIDPEFKDCFIKYKDAEDFAFTIRDLSTDDDRLRKLTSKTIETMRKYSLSNLRERFESIICDH